MNEVNETPQLEAKSKAPRILLEIFVFGIEEDKPKIKKLLDEMQKQMDSQRRNKHKVRIMWYIDKGEKTKEEKIEWFKENANCKYYYVFDQTSVEKDFVRNLLNKIRTFETAFNSIKAAEIKILGMKEQPKEVIEEATVVDDEK